MERRYQALMADESTLKKFIEELKSELDAIPKAKGKYKLTAEVATKRPFPPIDETSRYA